MGQGELRDKEHSSKNKMGQGELRDKEHSSNHGLLLFWNAEVKVYGMTLPLP
jgi:hypothetical protein